MEQMYSIDLKKQDLWAFIVLDKNNQVVYINNKALMYFENLKVGSPFLELIDWFRKAWLTDSVFERLIKGSNESKYFMEFISKEEDCKQILIKDTNEYRDGLHLWCEIGESIIGVQPFINGYNDAILITNEKGIIRVSNSYFNQISGLKNEDFINKSIFTLEENNLIPYCAIMDVIKTQKPQNSVVKFSNGKEVVMSASPIFNNDGKMIRIMSNTRDVSKLNQLYSDLSHGKFQNSAEVKKRNVLEALEKVNINIRTFRSPAMRNILNLISEISAYDIPLLLTGESGVGKTLLAKCICLAKKNSLDNFIHINCSAIPDSLIESILFGYEKSAFTGADKSKEGLFEVAKDGVILLDEIGDMPLHLQTKLLNVLQEKKFYRIGGTKPIDLNAEIIAATNHDLKALIKKGEFRKDLYFRLNVMPIHIPPLRERKEDILELADQILQEINHRFSRNKLVDEGAKKILISYDWPGNIRELKSILERGVILSKGDIITSADLLNALSKSNDAHQENDEVIMLPKENLMVWEPGQTLKNTIMSLEAKIIEQAIETYGTIKNAAKVLGVDESTINRKRNKARN